MHALYVHAALPRIKEMEDVAVVQDAIKAALEGFEEQQCLSGLLKGTLSESTKYVFHKFSSTILQTMATCIANHEKVRVALARERALIKFHQIRQSTLPNIWKELFTGLSLPLPSTICQQAPSE